MLLVDDKPIWDGARGGWRPVGVGYLDDRAQPVAAVTFLMPLIHVRLTSLTRRSIIFAISLVVAGLAFCSVPNVDHADGKCSRLLWWVLWVRARSNGNDWCICGTNLDQGNSSSIFFAFEDLDIVEIRAGVRADFIPPYLPDRGSALLSLLKPSDRLGRRPLRLLRLRQNWRRRTHP